MDQGQESKTTIQKKKSAMKKMKMMMKKKMKIADEDGAMSFEWRERCKTDMSLNWSQSNRHRCD